MLSGLHQIRKLKIFGATLALSFAFISAYPVSATTPTYTTDGSPIEHGVNLELSVAPTLQVVIPASTVSLNLTPNPDPSKSVFASENLTVSVATNNPTGYSLILKADSTNLTNTVADRNGDYSVLSTLTDLEGGYTEETFTVNRWGYRNTNTLLDNIATTTAPGNYNAFTTSSEILSSKLPTNLDQTSLDFAAKIDITQPAGTYELALDFTAVANMVPGVVTIIFDPNTGTGQMQKQQIESGTSQNLIPNTFTKEHYIFTGWNTEPDGTGAHYANAAPYNTTLDVANSSVTLYAQWQIDSIDGATYMQDITSGMVSNTPDGMTKTLTDKRDNNTYTVAKINGILWMTQNLRIAKGAALTNETSNVSQNYTIPTADLTLGNTYTEGRVHDSGNTANGYWYNYCAASAGTVCGDSNSAAVAYDICPKGWRLPTHEEQISITNYMVDFMPIAGGYYGLGSNISPKGGFWWSSTMNAATVQYGLNYNGSSLGTALGHDRVNGYYVRCVAK